MRLSVLGGKTQKALQDKDSENPNLPLVAAKYSPAHNESGGGGIRNPKVVVTTSEQTPHNNAIKRSQNIADKRRTDVQHRHGQTDSQRDRDTDLRQQCALCVHLNRSTTPLPDDLAEVIEAWPNLPELIKAGIRALIQG